MPSFPRLVRTRRTLSRVCLFLPGVWLLQVGCLPDDAFRTVLAENIVRTASLAIQSFVALLFGQYYPFA